MYSKQLSLAVYGRFVVSSLVFGSQARTEKMRSAAIVKCGWHEACVVMCVQTWAVLCNATTRTHNTILLLSFLNAHHLSRSPHSTLDTRPPLFLCTFESNSSRHCKLAQTPTSTGNNTLTSAVFGSVNDCLHSDLAFSHPEHLPVTCGDSS